MRFVRGGVHGRVALLQYSDAMRVRCFRYLEPTPDRRINIVDVRQWEKDTILVCYDDEYSHRHSTDFQGNY